MSSAALHDVKELIFSGEIPIGRLVSANKIAKSIGIGRNPVREAFLVLEEAGLIRLEGNAGAIVISPDSSELEALLVTRIVLESIACERVAIFGTEKAKQDIKLCHENLLQEAKKARGNFEKQNDFYKLDFAFHNTIAQSTGVDFLSHQMAMLLDKLRMFAIERRAEPVEIGIEHQSIVDAICANYPPDQRGRQSCKIQTRKAVFSHLLHTARRWSPATAIAIESSLEGWSA